MMLISMPLHRAGSNHDAGEALPMPMGEKAHHNENAIRLRRSRATEKPPPQHLMTAKPHAVAA